MSCLNPVLSVLLASTAFFSVTATGSVHAQIQAPINASINIPAQPLSAALIAFSRQTQIEIFAPTSLSANKQSSPVKGNLAPEDALKGLLVGTGLQYRFPESLLVTQNNHARGQNLHIYVIVNNALIPEFSMSRERALPIIGRAYGILLKSQTKQGLIALYNFGERTGMEIDIASIDQQVPYSMLNPLSVNYMRKVYNIGYDKMMKQRLWAKRPVFNKLPLIR